jgi:hypothetical protein
MSFYFVVSRSRTPGRFSSRNSTPRPSNAQFPAPKFQVILAERLSLWQAFTYKKSASLCFAIGGANRGGRLGLAFDRAGVHCHERAYSIAARLIRTWEARLTRPTSRGWNLMSFKGGIEWNNVHAAKKPRRNFCRGSARPRLSYPVFS